MLTIQKMLDRAKAERRAAARRRLIQNIATVAFAMLISAIAGGIVVKAISNIAADQARLRAGEIVKW